MYNYRYINQLIQFGSTSYTLVLEDIENQDRPIVIIDKTFRVENDLIDDSFLYQDAKEEILKLQGAEVFPAILFDETTGQVGPVLLDEAIV